MKVITYSHARNALKSVLDAVIMSLAHYNSLMETLYLLSTPANARALECAIKQDRAGRRNQAP